MNTKPIPAVLYAAKSSPDEGGSIAEQLTDDREAAEADCSEIVGDYSEENVSAYKGDRGPELARAIEHAADVGGVLYVQHSDRLARGDGRRARHLAEIAFEALHRGFTLRSVEDPSTFESIAATAAMGDRNFEDSRRKANSVRKGHRRSRAEGNIGGSRSLGYDLLPKLRSGSKTPRKAKIIPGEAVIVERIYDEFLAGKPQLRISRDLARDGVPTACGGQWSQSTVGRILKNPIYTGLVRLGGRKGTEFVEGSHEPIIERSKWQEVQMLIGAKARTHRRGREPRGSHLFRRGHLRCECGAAMIPRTERGEREVYRCHARFLDPANCSMPPIARAEVDNAVFAYFAEVGLDIEATREQLRKARDHKLAEVGALLAAAEAEAMEAAAAVERIERDYSRGKLDVEDWQRIRERLAPELEAAEAERDRLRDQFAQVDADADFLNIEAGVVGELAQLRSLIAGEVKGAAGIEAVRSVLLRQFEQFFLRREGTTGPDPATVYLDDDRDGMRWIEPVPNWQAIEGFDEQLRPVLRREPLGKAENNNDRLSTGS